MVKYPCKNPPFYESAVCPAGATGSQSDGRLGDNCVPAVREAFSQFTSTIQIVQNKEKKKRKDIG